MMIFQIFHGWHFVFTNDLILTNALLHHTEVLEKPPDEIRFVHNYWKVHLNPQINLKNMPSFHSMDCLVFHSWYWDYTKCLVMNFISSPMGFFLSRQMYFRIHAAVLKYLKKNQSEIEKIDFQPFEEIIHLASIQPFVKRLENKLSEISSEQ